MLRICLLSWSLIVCAEGSDIELIFNLSYSFAHEGPIYHEKSHSFFFTSNRLIRQNNIHIEINRLYIDTLSVALDIVDGIPMANGAYLTAYDTILFCAQGNQTFPAGIYEFNITSYKVTPVVTEYDNGQLFNSPNDIIVKDGHVWFTDPSYGYEQGFRPKPKSNSNKVFRGKIVYDLYGCCVITNVTAVIQDLVQPNGITIDQSGSYLYVTDTGHQTNSTDRKPEAYNVYCYTLVDNQPTNRQIFTSIFDGIPDGIKFFTSKISSSIHTLSSLSSQQQLLSIDYSHGSADLFRNEKQNDSDESIYIACGDGVRVYNKYDGALQRVIEVPNGVPNFVFFRRSSTTASSSIIGHRLEAITDNTNTSYATSSSITSIDSGMMDDSILILNENRIYVARIMSVRTRSQRSPSLFKRLCSGISFLHLINC